MLTRTKKQIGYGIAYVIAFTAFIFLLAVGIAGPGDQAPPAPTPTPPVFEDIQLEEASVIQHAPTTLSGIGTVDIVARLRNPNPRAGLEQYTVTFVLRNSTGAELGRQQATTYILPGSLQYVLALNVPVDEQVTKVDVNLPKDPDFETVPLSLELPRFSIFSRDRTIRQIGDRSIEETVGVVENTSTFDWQETDVIGVGIGASGNVTGVSRTSVGALVVGGQREFTLQWPQPPIEPTVRTLLIPSTNIFRDDNFLRAIGDPSQLR